MSSTSCSMSRAQVPFLAIGHTARDEFPDGRWRLGGSALYGAATAAKLGAAVTLVTRAGPNERGSLETLCDELGILVWLSRSGREVFRLTMRISPGR